MPLHEIAQGVVGNGAIRGLVGLAEKPVDLIVGAVLIHVRDAGGQGFPLGTAVEVAFATDM